MTPTEIETEKKYLKQRINNDFDYDYFVERASILEFDEGLSFTNAREQVIHELLMARLNKLPKFEKQATVKNPTIINVPNLDTGILQKICLETGEILEPETN